MENQTNSTATRTWGIDPAHSHIRFIVRHMVVSKASGHFGTFSGTVTTEGNNFNTAQINFEADTASITTGIADRDAHLRSDDFFNAEAFPKVLFTSTKISKIDDENYKMEGNLTLRDVTKHIELNVESGGMVKDPWGNERAGFHITGKVNRKDFGLNWSMLIETGGAIVSDTVTIDCDVEVVSPAA